MEQRKNESRKRFDLMCIKLVHLGLSVLLFYIFWLWYRFGRLTDLPHYGFRYNYYVAIGYSENSKSASKLMRADQVALTIADKIMFLNSAEADYYVSCAGLSDSFDWNKAVIAPLVVSSYFSDEKDEYDNDGIPHVFWMGNYIPLHGIKKAIEACGLLYKRGYKFHLTLWGNQNVDISPYSQLVHELGIDDFVSFRSDWRGQEYYHKEIRKQDIVLGIFGDSEKAKTVIVNKILDAVCENTTVLTAPSKGLELYFDGENDIWYCDNNPDAIANRMIEIINSDPQVKANREKKAYEIYEKNFSVSAFNRTVAQIIEEIKTEKGIN